MVLIKLVQIIISRLACLTVKGSVTFKHSIIRKLKIIVDVNNNIIMNNFHGYGIYFKILGGGNSLEVNGNCTNCRFSIEGNQNIVTVHDAVELTDCDIVCIGDNCRISIGKGTTVGGANIVCVGDSTYIEIGNDCMFSSNIDIFNSDTHQILSENKVINKNESIGIGNHVWIGKNSSILKGVIIGDNSIIGMNTTVTKEVEKGTIVVGNPARVIKKNITWNRNRVM